MIRLNPLDLIPYNIRLFVLALCLFTPALAAGQVDVLTQHNDMGRTGQNLNETVLTTSNVNVNSFGKLFARAVDGQMYAQPLYVSNLTIQGTARNVVFAATMHNSVYAFDADDPNATAPLWQVNLGTSVPSNDVCIFSPTPGPDCPYNDINPEIGILATPVIDTASGTLFVVAKTKNTVNTTFHFHLHALDITSGAEKFGGPVEITAQVGGTGDGSVNGTVTFDPLYHLNRPGLLLMNGVVYLAFGSIGDSPPYHGWVLAYDATTLQQVGIFNTTPNGGEGAIWQAGQGLMGAGGNVYFMTGNGTFDADTGGKDYGDSFVKLSTAAGLSVADYFTPFDQAYLNTADVDLGSGGPMALPGTNLIVGIGKDGTLRLVDPANMGKFNPTTNNDVQEIQVYASGYSGSGYVFLGGPIYWNSPNNGPVIYLWGPNDYLKSFKFTGSLFQTTPVSQSSMTEAPGWSNAVPLSLSANGSQAGTGIVWASAAEVKDANLQTVGGILRAFDATNLSVELWDSKQNATRDDVGNYAKFAPPTIANGKVYLSTFSGQLLTYGINTFTVTPSTGTGGNIAPATPQTVNFNTTTSFTVTPSTGYQIASVIGCGGILTGNTYTTGAITGNCTVAASFSVMLTVTFSAGTGGTITGTTSQTIVSGGSTAPVTAVPNTGYHFVNWTGTGGFTSTANPLTVTNVTANQTITANFAINTFTVTPSAGTGGSISPNTPQTVNYNGTTSFTVTPTTGYNIASVTGCGGSLTGNTYTTGAITGNCTVAASFSVMPTVTFIAGTGGTITGTTSQTIVSGGSTTPVTAVPNTGYSFVNWTGTGGFTSTANPLTVTNVTANQSITANFAIPHDGIVNFAAGKTAPDIGDALTVFQYVMGKTTLSDLQKAHADVAPLTGPNGSPLGNGAVDLSDVIIILRRVVGAVTW